MHYSSAPTRGKPSLQENQAMKLYGRTQDQSSKLKILVEATFVAEPSALRELASFLYRCADAIEDHGDEWEHDNFESNENTAPEIVVFNPNVVDG